MAIDDFSFLKGQSYGTVFIDHNTHLFIDIIDTRTKDDVAERMKKFSNVKIVTRDRANSYGGAIKKALPKAIQIADKFHLDKNLTDKAQEYIRSEFPDKIYLDENYKIVKYKKEATYTVSRKKIITVLFKGINVLKKLDRKLVKKKFKQNKEMEIIIEQIIKFRNITNKRDSRGLKNLLKKWRKSSISFFRTFMRGVDNDIEAVLNCAKYKETNGLAEGKINKVKTIKRMLYGKAGPDLLKGRLFLSDYFHSIE